MLRCVYKQILFYEYRSFFEESKRPTNAEEKKHLFFECLGEIYVVKYTLHWYYIRIIITAENGFLKSLIHFFFIVCTYRYAHLAIRLINYFRRMCTRPHTCTKWYFLREKNG